MIFGAIGSDFQSDFQSHPCNAPIHASLSTIYATINYLPDIDAHRPCLGSLLALCAIDTSLLWSLGPMVKAVGKSYIDETKR